MSTTAGADNLSAGHAMSCDDVERLFPEAQVYDDAELTRALVEQRAPRAEPVVDLAPVEAFSIEDHGGTASIVAGGLAMPLPGVPLRLNPLYRPTDRGWSIAWPSPRYRAEYEGRATFPCWLGAQHPGVPAVEQEPTPDLDAVRRRVFVDLPERW